MLRNCTVNFFNESDELIHSVSPDEFIRRPTLTFSHVKVAIMNEGGSAFSWHHYPEARWGHT